MDVPSIKQPITLPMPGFAVKRGIVEAEAIPDAAVLLYEHVADDCHTTTLIVLGYYYECPRCVLVSNDAAYVMEWDWRSESWMSVQDKWVADSCRALTDEEDV